MSCFSSFRRLSTATWTHAYRQFSQQANHLQSWQKGCWESYLASGRGSDDLFKSIDSNKSQSLSVEELHVFLDSVDHKGVHPRAFKMLDELAHDHPITLKEFKSWLVLATNLGHENHSSFSYDYESHPETGDRLKRCSEEDYHSWNEVTMSQNVRRMQYAVRGQVVMRADALKAEGKEILYTNIGKSTVRLQFRR